MKKVILALFVFPIVDVMFHTEKAKGLDAYTLCLAGLLFAFTFIVFLIYLWKGRNFGQHFAPAGEEVREPDLMPARFAAIESEFGPITRKIAFSHYIDDIAANAFAFDTSRTLLVFNRPIKYDDIERTDLEFSGEYCVKIWLHSDHGHYVAFSSSNGRAAKALKDELDRIFPAGKTS